MIPTKAITDRERCEFLRKLDQHRAGSQGLLLTSWESDFINNFLHDGRTVWFTDGRRASADKMRMKYGEEIGMPMPAERPQDNRTTGPQDPNGCQFLVRDESGRQSPCNQPAVKQRPNGFRYCQGHAEQVQEDCQRRKIRLALRDLS